MIILPAIDLYQGQCVRLHKGDYATAHRVADDPLEVAKRFIDAGASMLHVVDLDAAKHGRLTNADVIAALCRLDVALELGGGLRDDASLAHVDGLGVTRMIIGSAAVRDPAFVTRAVARYGSRIAVGIDALDGEVKTDGWLQNSGRTTLDLAKQMETLGVGTLIVTDIDRDGMMAGCNVALYQALKQAVDCAIVASGGVSSEDDLAALHGAGIDAAIVGKAAYTGAIDVADAIARYSCGV